MHIPKKVQFMNGYAADIIMKLNMEWLLCAYLHIKDPWKKNLMKKFYNEITK